MILHPRRFSGSSRGFSLVELILVLAIILILSAIAMINFAEAQVRAKTVRAKVDLRTLAVGLESYHVDHNDYPPNPGFAAVMPGGGRPPGAGPNISPFRLTTPVAYLSVLPKDPFKQGVGDLYGVNDWAYREEWGHYDYYKIITEAEWDALCSGGEPICPALIAVHGEIPRPGEEEGRARYVNTGAFQKYGRWAAWSAGPDRLLWRETVDFALPRDPLRALNPPPYPPAGFTFDLPYDPTNGTVSFGNIGRYQVGMWLGIPVGPGPDTDPPATVPSPSPAPTRGSPDPEPTDEVPPGASPPPSPTPGDAAEPSPSPTPGGDNGGDDDNRSPKRPGPDSGPRPAGGGPGGVPPPGGGPGGGGARSPSSSSRPSPPEASGPRAQRPGARPGEPAGPNAPKRPVERKAETRGPGQAPPAWSLFIALNYLTERGWALLLLILGLLLLLLYWLLRKLRKRREFAVYDSSLLTDEDVARLAGAPGVAALNLSLSAVSDGGLAPLAGAKSLISLNLWRTGVTDEGMEAVGRIAGLTDLILMDTPVTNEGIRRLSGLRSLRNLVLAGTPVDDGAIESLSRLTSLRSLNLRGTKVSEEGAARLQAALPECLVLFGPERDGE